MKTVLALLLFISTPTFADEWTSVDTKREVAYQLLLAVDWAQTRSFIRDNRYWEQNPILGNHPSRDKVDAAVIISSIGHYYISKTLPEKYRKPFQYGTIAIEVGYVAHNFSIGVSAKF